MTFVEATKTCLRKYADFKGRASRSEYWWFYLFTILVTVPLGIVDGIIFGFEEDDLELFSSLASLALFLPTLSATVRRYHDIDRSGWWILGIIGGVILGIFGLAFFASDGSSSSTIIALLSGLLVLGVCITHLVWLVITGTSGHNRYGSDPLADDTSVFD